MRTVLTILLIAVIGGICALEAVFIRQGRRMPKRSCVRLSVAYPIVGVVFGGHVPVFNEHGRPRAGLQPVGRHGLSRVRADGRQPDPGVDQLPHLV